MYISRSMPVAIGYPFLTLIHIRALFGPLTYFLRNVGGSYFFIIVSLRPINPWTRDRSFHNSYICSTGFIRTSLYFYLSPSYTTCGKPTGCVSLRCCSSAYMCSASRTLGSRWSRHNRPPLSCCIKRLRCKSAANSHLWRWTPVYHLL